MVYNNLKNSFPQKEKTRLIAIEKEFYHHFCDLLVESIKIFNISKGELIKRCRLVNPSLLKQYAQKNKSVIIYAGHYNNWELAATACNLQMPHQTVVIYAPLKNKFIDRQVQESRTKYGTVMWPMRQVKVNFEQQKTLLKAVLFAGDQSPTIARSAYWTSFLNQDTGVMIGAEKYAKKYDYPVLFGKISKIKRGYYQFEFIPLENNPSSTKFGEISEKYTRILESVIVETPQYWLWSHRRWKKKRPKKN